MGLKATWVINCDSCDLMVTKEIELTAETIDKNRYWLDIWGPGIPDGWLQQTREDEAPLFFHSRECYKQWLIGQGKLEEAEAFDKAVWYA